MKKYQGISIVLFFQCASLLCFSQTKIIEGLKRNIVAASTPQNKLSAQLLLCEQGYSLHSDTLMFYALQAQDLALQLKDDNASVQSLYFRSVALTGKGLIDSSLQLANQCLQILQSDVKDQTLLCNVLNQKGRCFVRKNQYKEAIEMGYKIIATAENINDTLLQIKAKTLIGWAYLEMGQTKEALSWHLKALHTTNDSILLQKYAILFANLATNYGGLNKLDSAFFYINKGISYARKHENLFALSNSLAIASQLYVRSGQAKLSEPVLKEVVAIRKLIGDPFYIASDMSQLGLYYAHYGEPEKGVAICKEGIAIAKQYHLDTKLFFLYSSLADNYKAMGNSTKYAEVLEDIIDLKDAVFEKNTASALVEMQAKYEVQKKENTIIRQRLDLVTKNYWLYGSMILSFFTLFLIYILFKNYRKKEKLKMDLMLVEEKRLAQVSIKAAQENERKRIAADLHDNLGAYAAAISSSVDYLSVAETAAGEQSILEELKSNAHEIVAQLNDTIWVLTKEELALTAISDRLKVFIQRLLNSYPAVQIDVIEKIKKDQLLPPMQAFHLFKILQEGITNALKHSNCTAITISIESDTNWQVIIKDNGNGLTANLAATLGGNGLRNMKNRSKEAGWLISWEQLQPKGTQLIIAATTN